jgi:uncharacterized protein YbgA (DUF1722 family)
LKKNLDPAERMGLAGIIHDYRKGVAPRVVPIALLRHSVQKFQLGYSLGQAFLQPHPKELLHRNRV